ncbi:MmcQ/YjbR family DNA-binding protein [Mordavella massiliensis]|uniref:MmcQ/YjbR family DNA-binding protein n=2 Tax=Mordavella massiliensis TaxID=1871024 RepID=A0A938XB30_9CLOT|nr:MmcQ/YjbR family DNA-binding protein [Mordavella massiliensis]
MMREAIFRYVKETYKTEPDYPFSTAPTYPVLRHADNRKWFALLMDVSREKLGLKGTEHVDIINVKLGDPMLVDMLVRQPGYFYGYHIARSNWISILLDGTVPFEEVCRWIDESYAVTASRQKKQKIRPPKEWIVPANPKYYDIVHAFDSAGEIDWKQGRGIRTGDTVYLYAAAPVSAILYKCKVTETDIPCHYSDRALTIPALMKIRLLKRYRPDRFTFEKLKEEYGIYAVRGPRGVPHSLGEALKK